MRFETADFDLKITGITIIDGTGEPGYLGDVGIRDGKISVGNTLPGGLFRGSCDRAVGRQADLVRNTEKDMII